MPREQIEGADAFPDQGRQRAEQQGVSAENHVRDNGLLHLFSVFHERRVKKSAGARNVGKGDEREHGRDSPYKQDGNFGTRTMTSECTGSLKPATFDIFDVTTPSIKWERRRRRKR